VVVRPPLRVARRSVTSWFTVTAAWRSLGRHPMRAALTMLGVTIGVGAVITMVSIGEGAQRTVMRQMESMGANVLEAEAGNRMVQGVSTASNALMYDDVVAVRQECSAVAYASPHVDFRAQVGHGNLNWNTRVRGVDVEFLTIRALSVVEGDFFSPSAVASTAKVAVLGRTVVRQLFASATNPIGETIRVNKTPFRVVGVLSAKGASVGGDDQDDVVLMPWTTAQRKMAGIKYINDMFASAVDRSSIGLAKKQISALLRQRHHLTADQPDDFNIRDFTEIAEAVKSTNQVMTLLLSTVAALSLLVGGINTMSIMLVSVTERTREIGVRMAVGARAGDVRFQFLLEAMLLTLIGGIAGIGVGVVCSVAITRSMQWPTVISTSTIVVGIGISTAVGLIFGYYPALRASALDPIEALRFE
jgi:putative ABC transport system permease protein